MLRRSETNRLITAVALAVALATALATPAAAKNAKLGDEVLGEWCFAFSGSEGRDFWARATTNADQCSEAGMSIRQNGHTLEEGGWCEALKTEIIDYVAGATRGQGPDLKPLLPFSAVATPVYRVKYRCSGEGIVLISVQTLTFVKGYLEVREIRHGRERPLR
jgi:uncharacterized membrane protein